MLKHGQYFRPHQIQKSEMISRSQYQADRAHIKRNPLPYRSVIGLDLEKMTSVDSLMRIRPRTANGYTPTFGPTPVVQQAEVVEAVYQVEVVEEVCQVEVVEAVQQAEVVKAVQKAEVVEAVQHAEVEEAVQQAEVVEEVQEPVDTPLSSPVRRFIARKNGTGRRTTTRRVCV